MTYLKPEPNHFKTVKKFKLYFVLFRCYGVKELNLI